MPDTKRGRDEQARQAERRQRDREVREARERGDEAEPAQSTGGETEGTDEVPRCHRRDCDAYATFVVLERYQEDTGHGTVEAEALLCTAHTAEEGPANLDPDDESYLFRVRPLAGTESPETT